MAQFRLLGPVEVWAGGRRVDAGQPRQRAVFAALLADAGRSVPVDTLVDRTWGDTPPIQVRRSLHAHITRIRGVLEHACEVGEEPVRLVFHSGGYLLDVDVEHVDVHRFRRLAAQARDPLRSAEQVAVLLREALGLWRGEPLAGLPGRWAGQCRQTWRQQYVDVTVAWAQAELAVGNPAAVIGPLSELGAEFPLVESVAATLMQALQAAGRPAEALAHYARVRERLVEELGADPSPGLRAVHQAILRGEVKPPAARPGTAAVAPAQLPADVSGFVGRAEHLARLDALLTDGPAVAPTAVLIAVVFGTAGVGKTALAVNWARRVRDRFPDGQLYVNLRGFDPAGSPAQPAEALRGFLDALGVAPKRIPADVAAQAALYRSLLTGRRMLILLDNAEDAGQVRPLLPGEPACMVVVTSRNQLSGLVVTEGAHLLPVRTLPVDEARDLLARRIGQHRVRAESMAVDAIVMACARLPLALAIAAARAATSPHFTLHAIAQELRDARRRLDPFAGSDPATDVRAVFSWSYRSLRPAAARMFRLLGLHPAPDAGLSAVASLTGLPIDDVRPLVVELLEANLLVEEPAGRFSCHDLLREYARELTHRIDTESERHTALLRVLDHYVHSALAGDRLLYPHRFQIRHELTDPAPGAVPEALPNPTAAMTWFMSERRVLGAAVELAASAGFDLHAWLLPLALGTFFERQWNGRDWVACNETSLAVAERAGNRAWQARTHNSIGYLQRELGRLDESQVHLTIAAQLFRELGSATEQANAHLNLGITARRQGRLEEALDQAGKAVHAYQSADDLTGQASALNNMGWCEVSLGRYEEALAHCRRAVTIQEAADNRPGAAHAWDSVGYVHHHLGQYQEAIVCFRKSRDLFHELDDRRYEAIILTHLGDAHRADGDHPAAIAAWRQALALFTQIDHPDAGPLRDKIADELARADRAPSAMS